MTGYTLNLTPKLYDYLLKNSLREPAVLAQLRAQTKTMSTHKMQISPEQGQFMQLLVRLMGARKTLEVGVYTGYSSLAVALALPSDGQVIACDVNIEWTKIAKQYWEMANVSDKIDLRIGDALETLDQLLASGHANTIDFAFIDADKKNYLHYYEKALQLVRPGGLIAIDNVLWDGDVANPDVQDENTVAIRELNAFIHQDARVSMSLVPIGDGVTLVSKNA